MSNLVFRLGVTVGVDVNELNRLGQRNTDGMRWLDTLDTLQRQFERLDGVKETELVVNGIYAVTFEGTRDIEFYQAKVERVARRVFRVPA